MKSFKQFVKEDVYGGLSTIFHRTQSIDSIDAIKDSGFKAGAGDMYGRAIYGTYSLKSQFNDRMRKIYGDYIVKAKVNNNRILFLDMDQAKKVYGKNHSLVDQLKTINPRFQITDKIEEISNELLRNPKYTSDIALDLLKISEIKKTIYGISLTGRRDGNVLVVYNEESITPMSYNSTIENSSKLDQRKWEDIKNINLVRKGLDKTLAGFYEIPSDNYKVIGGNKNDLRKNYKWVLDAKIKKVEIDLSKNKFEWINGTWEYGKWKNGTWKNGTWYCGIWENGTWENGTWERGAWINGTWKNGTWENGTWDDGLWWNGTWKDGIWDDGSWWNGIWDNGSWWNGIWECGTWKDGIWEDGTWNCGTWEKGVWCYGTWCDGTWNCGTWNYGEWNNGTWCGGTWCDGKIYSDKYDKMLCSSVDPKTFCQYESESDSLEELQSKIK
jgi:hypothetical protein